MNETYRVPVGDGDRIRAGLAVQLVAAATGVTAERMRARARLGGAECRARWLAIYLAYISFGWPLERVGHAFGLNRATVAAACRWVEEERGRPALDAMLERLERCAHEVVDAPLFEVPA